MPKKQTFFQKRSVIATFGILALIGGALFVRRSGVTGNVVGFGGSFSIITFIGLLLLVCSIVLIAYSVVHKD